MKVLLTGASSFSGVWFAQALRTAGCDVVAPLARKVADYEGGRAARVARLADHATLVPECRFGEERFLSLVKSQSFDVLCHHAAQVADYRSPDFDALGAARENTQNLRPILAAMREHGLKAVIATGSVFEPDEGRGEEPRRAFSPYGLSKGLTWQIIRYWCAALNIPAGKFVIANPFGPMEEPRFVTYLVKTWRAGATAEIRTPAYVRDNIHVDLLALTYARFVLDTARTGQSGHFGPCGYVETQGAFGERVAAEFRGRLGLECGLRLLPQTEFAEPKIRTNTTAIDPASYGWSESAAWDAAAAFYDSGFGKR